MWIPFIAGYLGGFFTFLLFLFYLLRNPMKLMDLMGKVGGGGENMTPLLSKSEEGKEEKAANAIDRVIKDNEETFNALADADVEGENEK